LQLVHASRRWNAGRPELDPKILQRVMEKLAHEEDTKTLRIPAADDAELSDVTAPAAAVPVVFADELHAVVLYGAHSSGADIDHLEARLLEDFAARMALAYEKYFKKSMPEELRALREQLGAT
jgi:hypothetical protein